MTAQGPALYLHLCQPLNLQELPGCSLPQLRLLVGLLAAVTGGPHNVIPAGSNLGQWASQQRTQELAAQQRQQLLDIAMQGSAYQLLRSCLVMCAAALLTLAPLPQSAPLAEQAAFLLDVAAEVGSSTTAGPRSIVVYAACQLLGCDMPIWISVSQVKRAGLHSYMPLALSAVGATYSSPVQLIKLSCSLFQHLADRARYKDFQAGKGPASAQVAEQQADQVWALFGHPLVERFKVSTIVCTTDNQLSGCMCPQSLPVSLPWLSV